MYMKPLSLNFKQPTQLTKMAQPRKCVAIRDYTAKRDDELSFKEGDVIFVPKREAGERWQGVFNGQTGYFPKIFVEDKTVEVQAGKTTKVRAVRAYEAQTEEELSFPADVSMFVVARESEKYWKGVYDGKAGLIPSECVEDASEKPEQAKEFTGAKCKAIRPNEASDPSQLAFNIGDTVFVPVPDPALDEWKGVCNSQVGVFPRTKVVDVAKITEEKLTALLAKTESMSDEDAAAEALKNLTVE
eukprot:m.92787 g.92787  ORF g.92787 m.92787 type:complete len:244 (-) comp12990_c0_seq2:5540-6271(-)